MILERFSKLWPRKNCIFLLFFCFLLRFKYEKLKLKEETFLHHTIDTTIINTNQNRERNIHKNAERNMRMHQSAENESLCCQKGCAQLDANYLDASSACLQMYTFKFWKCILSYLDNVYFLIWKCILLYLQI